MTQSVMKVLGSTIYRLLLFSWYWAAMARLHANRKHYIVFASSIGLLLMFKSDDLYRILLGTALYVVEFVDAYFGETELSFDCGLFLEDADPVLTRLFFYRIQLLDFSSYTQAISSVHAITTGKMTDDKYLLVERSMYV